MLRRRAQKHQEAVHLATKEAMLSDEDEISNVDALEAEFRSMTQDVTKICLGSAATALLGQLQGVGPCAALDQLIDLQRRHSILQSILHFEEERERELKVPQPPERPFEQRSRPGHLPPLTPRGRETSRATSRASSSRASSRGSSATVRTVRSVRKVSRSTSRVSVRSVQSKVKETVKEKEVEVVRSSPGPAAVGYREISLQEMKEEIEEERKRYIAERLN